MTLRAGIPLFGHHGHGFGPRTRQLAGLHVLDSGAIFLTHTRGTPAGPASD